MEIKPNSLGETIFRDKYAYPGETKWSQLARRVAKSASMAEQPEDIAAIEKRFYEIINSGDFCPGGRILFGAGRPNQNLLNCYVLDPEDNVDSIAKIVSDMYKISCGGGGIGFNFSKIRPKGDDISNIPNSAPGSISVMRMINEIGNHVRAGKNRRTALMSILNISHPDLLEFLEVKLDRGELTNFNISVAITSRFIEAVENDDEWYFTFGGRHTRYDRYKVDRLTSKPSPEVGNIQASDFDKDVETIYVVAKSPEDALARARTHYLKNFDDTFENPVLYPIKAKDLWDKLISNAIECGEPGIFNIDFANEFTNVSHIEDMPSTNPCGEEVLPAYGNCCLGHVNLANMVGTDGIIDWKRLAKAVRTGVRFLDNILSVNHFPIPECKEVGERTRRIGLGVTGFHYMLIKAGYRYGSEACIEFTERLFDTIRNEAYKASMYLARDKGCYAAYDWTKLKKEKYFKTIPSRIRYDIRKYGLRNAVLLTVAPTGTISMVLGVSTGIEPIFSPIYRRRWRTGTDGVWNETVVVDPMFKDAYLRGMSLDHIVGAYDVTPEEHIKMQAVIQARIDSAVSKTCNLPKDFTLTDETKEVLLEYAKEMKGFTFYKAGSRGNEPLEIIDFKTVDLDKVIFGEKVEFVTEGRDCANGVCEL
jgi:ribonucleoside-diphosphate reductase alpha chain